MIRQRLTPGVGLRAVKARLVAQRQRGAAAIMTTLILVQILVASPGLAVVGVFLTPFIHSFRWNHEQVSQLAFASTMTGGLVAPIVGWLMDRIGSRWVMAGGMVVMCLAYYIASIVASLGAMRLAFGALGAGMMLAGLPVLVVFVNWFEGRRGTAGGALFLAFGLGLMVAPPVLTWVIARWGWRVGMRSLCLPIIAVALPLTLVFMRTRPPLAQAQTVSQEVKALPGLELVPALGSLMFWLVAAGDMLYSCGFGSVFVHEITYLIGLGYTPEHAALVFSATAIVSSIGAIVLGMMGDRFGAKRVLTTASILIGFGILSFTAAGSPRFAIASIVLFVLLWGAPAGAMGALLPVLLAETTGLRRLATLSGVVRFGASFATAFGPVLAGHIYDMTGSYVPAFEIAIGLLWAAALSIAFVRPAKGHDAIPALDGKGVIVG